VGLRDAAPTVRRPQAQRHEARLMRMAKIIAVLVKIRDRVGCPEVRRRCFRFYLQEIISKQHSSPAENPRPSRTRLPNANTNGFKFGCKTILTPHHKSN
jgi:hypothetical protein